MLTNLRDICSIAEHQGEDGKHIVYWHDMTVAAYESFLSTFEHVVKVFANGAKPVA